MLLVIKLVGIITLIGNASSYRAVIPRWESHDVFCKEKISAHIAYVRVDSGAVLASGTTWPVARYCEPAQHCSLYQIPLSTSLEIGKDEIVNEPLKEGAKFCLLPKLNTGEMLEEGAEPAGDLDALKLTEIAVKSGIIDGYQFPNTMVASTLTQKLKTPTPSAITITARVTSGSNQVLKVKPGSEIIIVNLPPEMAGVDLSQPGPGATAKHHFYLHHKLLKPGPKNCQVPGEHRPCDKQGMTAKRSTAPHAHLGLHVVCSNAVLTTP
jgi:hypothetical protein